MNTYAYEHFRPNKRNFKWLWWSFIFPIFGLGAFVDLDRQPYIEKVRTGQIAYKDRKWKAKL